MLGSFLPPFKLVRLVARHTEGFTSTSRVCPSQLHCKYLSSFETQGIQVFPHWVAITLQFRDFEVLFLITVAYNGKQTRRVSCFGGEVCRYTGTSLSSEQLEGLPLYLEQRLSDQ